MSRKKLSEVMEKIKTNNIIFGEEEIKLNNSIDTTQLLQKQLPIFLHGLNPRTIKGIAWWNKERKQIFKNQNNCCYTCGTKDILDGHEIYTFNHKTGIIKLDSIIGLCRKCHNFIHSGRLEMLYSKGKISKVYIESILKRGIYILTEYCKKEKTELKLPYAKFEICEELNINIDKYLTFDIDNDDDEFRQDVDCFKFYKLKFENKLYPMKFKNINEWNKYYNTTNNNDNDKLHENTLNKKEILKLIKSGEAEIVGIHRIQDSYMWEYGNIHEFYLDSENIEAIKISDNLIKIKTNKSQIIYTKESCIETLYNSLKYIWPSKEYQKLKYCWLLKLEYKIKHDLYLHFTNENLIVNQNLTMEDCAKTYDNLKNSLKLINSKLGIVSVYTYYTN